MAVLKYSVALSTGAHSTTPLGGHHGCSFIIFRRTQAAPSHHRLPQARPAARRPAYLYAHRAVPAHVRRVAGAGGVQRGRAGARARGQGAAGDRASLTPPAAAGQAARLPRPALPREGPTLPQSGAALPVRGPTLPLAGPSLPLEGAAMAKKAPSLRL